MAANYSTALKNARLDLVDDYVNAGAAAGYIEIGTSGMGTVLATITMSDPAFSAAAAGVLTASGLPISDSSADAAGTAAEARIKDSDGNTVLSGLTVGTSGTDVVLTSATIEVGDVVTLSSITITHG